MRKTCLYSFLFFSLLLFSCKKYEEGKLIHFSSKTERLCKKWKIEKYTLNGNDHTAYIDSMYLSYEFRRDGSFQEIMAHTHMYYVADGSWDLIFKKRSLMMTRPGFGDDVIWEIKKLEENELWVVHHYDLVDEEYHLVPYQ